MRIPLFHKALLSQASTSTHPTFLYSLITLQLSCWNNFLQDSLLDNYGLPVTGQQERMLMIPVMLSEVQTFSCSFDFALSFCLQHSNSLYSLYLVPGVPDLFSCKYFVFFSFLWLVLLWFGAWVVENNIFSNFQVTLSVVWLIN